MSVNVSQCGACGRRVYPARLWCPACGHDQSLSVPVEQGEIQAWTTTADPVAELPVVVATVRALPEGPVLVVRLEETPSHAGQRVSLLERQTNGRLLPWARILPA